MEYLANTNPVDRVVAQYFVIDSITQAPEGQGHVVVRYEGCLRSEDSEAAYTLLSEALKPYGFTPLFRKTKDRQAILLINRLPQARPSKPWLNLGLLVLTLGSVLFTGAMFASSTGALDLSIRGIWGTLLSGWPFALSIMLILGTHEFGHYLVGRFHGEQVSLPYFIPFPGSEFGTMGAFINMKSPPRNRRVLLDIGIAGPLAGLLVAIPILLIGLSLSTVGPLTVPTTPGTYLQMEGNSILYLLAKFVVFHRWLPAPATYGAMPPLLYWIQYFFTGRPFPAGGLDVNVSPVAMAGWAGILVTALNLIPAGQLDGGHVLYVLFGERRSRLILPFILVALVALGFVWNGWWLWAALIFLLVGRTYAEPLDQITPLNPARKALAVLGLIMFILVFTPVPLQIFG